MVHGSDSSRGTPRDHLSVEAFLAGLLAESMYITSHGSFVLYDSHGQALSVLEEVNNVMVPASACLNHPYKIH